jgi:hypothetical protein
VTPLRRRRAALLPLTAVVAALVSTTGDVRRPGSAERAAAPAEPVVVAEPPRLALFPPTGARDVPPTDAAWVAAHTGTLTDVRLVNEEGRTIAGAMTPTPLPGGPPDPSGTDAPTR